MTASDGTCREITPPTRLVVRHGWEDDSGLRGPKTLGTITLTERDGGTETLFQETGLAAAAARDGHAGEGEKPSTRSGKRAPVSSR